MPQTSASTALRSSGRFGFSRRILSAGRMRDLNMAKSVGLRSASQAVKKSSLSTAKKARKGGSSRPERQRAKSASSIGARGRKPSHGVKLRRRTDAKIQAGIDADPDAAPILDAAWFATAVVVKPAGKQPLS